LTGVIVPFLLLAAGLWTAGCTRHDDADTHHPDTTRRAALPQQNSFHLTDVDGRTTILTRIGDRIQMTRIAQPIVVLHFLTTRTPQCRAMLPALDDLQRHDARRVFVLGIVVPETIDPQTLRSYMRRNGAHFFISLAPDNIPLEKSITSMVQSHTHDRPLTVIFDHGRYRMHYEGVTPIEMIRSDLNDLNTTAGSDTQHVFLSQKSPRQDP
jgi:hypothetical protein